MTKEIRWTRTLNAKVGGAMAALFAAVLVLTLASHYITSTYNGNARRANVVGRGRTLCYRTVYLLERYIHETREQQITTEAEIEETMAAMTERFRKLQSGDVLEGIPATTEAEILPYQDGNSRVWNTEIVPGMKRLFAAKSPESMQKELSELQPKLKQISDSVDKRIELENRIAQNRLIVYQWTLAALGIATLLAIGMLIAMSFGISRRIRSLASTSEQIAAGDLNLRAEIRGDDELTALAASFNSMTADLRAKISTEQSARVRNEELLATVRGAVGRLASVSMEILAAATQQAAGAQEQAAAVTETTATVTEVTQTSAQAAQLANEVSEAAKRATEVSCAGRRAIEETIVAMQEVSQQMASIAECTLTLAERAQDISEIISVVNDITDRTNLLALNAAIEASRAGEYGKGFSVVASEVKELAEQSKKATRQIQQILREIQDATNKAVLSTEQGSKAVGSATSIVSNADNTITNLTDTVAASALSAAQIGASSSQQAIGMTQINEAMHNIDRAARQTLTATGQTQQAARDINELGVQLKQLFNEEKHGIADGQLRAASIMQVMS